MFIKLKADTPGRLGMRLSQRFFSIVIFTIAAALASSAATAQTEFKLTASDALAGDLFGRRVSMDGDYAIVGAFYDDDGGSNSGSAYIILSGYSTSQPIQPVHHHSL